MELNDAFESTQPEQYGIPSSIPRLLPPFDTLDFDDIQQSDPEAAAILLSATQTVDAILKHRQYLDDDGRYDQPLYIVAGERHDKPGHNIHHMLVISILQETGRKLVCGIENEESKVHEHIEARLGVKTDNALYRRNFNWEDNKDNLALRWSFENMVSRSSPYSNKVLQNHLLQSGVPTRLTDATTKSTISAEEFTKIEDVNAHLILDPNDPKVAESMAALHHPIQVPVGGLSRTGVHIRNHYSAQRLMEHAEQHDAHFALNISGNGHVVEDGIIFLEYTDGPTFVDSLHNDDQAAIGIILSDERPSPPTISVSDDWRTTVLKGILAQNEYLYTQGTVSDYTYAPNTKSIKQVSQSEEKDWVDARLESLGLGDLEIDDLEWAMADAEKTADNIVINKIIVPMRVEAATRNIPYESLGLQYRHDAHEL